MLSWDNISILAKCDLKKKNQVPIYIYSLRYISNMLPNTLYPIYARKSQKLIEDNQRNYKIIHPLKYHTTRPSVHDIKCNNIMRSRQLRMKQFLAKTSHTRNSCSQIYMPLFLTSKQLSYLKPNVTMTSCEVLKIFSILHIITITIPQSLSILLIINFVLLILHFFLNHYLSISNKNPHHNFWKKTDYTQRHGSWYIYTFGTHVCVFTGVVKLGCPSRRHSNRLFAYETLIDSLVWEGNPFVL